MIHPLENDANVGSPNGLIAVTDGHPEAGAIVYWMLSGNLKIESLEAAWGDANLDTRLLPNATTPARALRRVALGRATKRLLARPLGIGQGWAMVAEDTVSGSDSKAVSLAHHTMVRLLLEQPQIEGAAPVLRVDPPGWEQAESVTSEWRQAMGEYDTAQIGGWLVDLMYRERGVALRDTGGMYFIPREHLGAWRRYAAAIQHCSDHVIYEIPALQTGSAIRAILDAVTREADEEVGKIETELDTADLSGEALRTRARRATEVLEKIGTYEALLGQRLVDLRSRIDRLNADLAHATLVAMGASAT